jgi:uncharacterized membrane protein
MEKSNQRIEFLDIMRGVAVVVMVIGHSIDSMLSVDARASEAFRLYDAVRGFTAPIFLFVAGFAFTVATERRWEDYRSLSRPLRSRLLKVFSLLIVGYALHLPFFSLTKLLHGTKPEEYALLFQADVLHCVAAGILILQAVVFVSKTPRAFGVVTAGLTTVIVLATPLVWLVDVAAYVGPVIAPYFNQTHASIFPLFPFAGFMFSGAALAHYFLAAYRSGDERRFITTVLKLALVAGVCGFVFDLLPITLYPPHDYWKTSPNFFLLRLSAVVLATSGFFFLRRLPIVLEHPIRALGQASLLVYAVHLVIVYGSPASNGVTQVVGKTLPYYSAAGIGVAVLLGMVLIAYLWNHARMHHAWPSRFVQAGLTSTIIYLFFTNPW